MQIYQKRGGERINYSSKRISSYLKPSQQDDASEQQHAAAIGSSTEQHGGPVAGSSTMTRSKRRLDDVNEASPHLLVDTHTRGGKVQTGVRTRDNVDTIDGDPIQSHESSSDRDNVANSRRDLTWEGNTDRIKGHDSRSGDPNRVIPDTDMSDYDNWPSDGDIPDGDIPDGNAGDDDCGDPEREIPDSYRSASKIFDGEISEGEIPEDIAEDEDWMYEDIPGSDDESDSESEGEPVINDPSHDPLVIGSNSDEVDGDDPTRVQVGEDRIRQALRVSIRITKDEAALMSSSIQSPMTSFSARFCRDHTVDELVNVWMPGFSNKAKAMFSKDKWSCKDLLDLPLAKLDTRTGVYLLVAVLKAIAVGGYVGSAAGKKGIKQRDGQHARNAKPSATAKGLLYELIRKTGVVMQNRVLASFAPPLPYYKYLVMLEGILSVWFSTLVKPTKNRTFSQGRAGECARKSDPPSIFPLFQHGSLSMRHSRSSSDIWLFDQHCQDHARTVA